VGGHLGGVAERHARRQMESVARDPEHGQRGRVVRGSVGCSGRRIRRGRRRPEAEPIEGEGRATTAGHGTDRGHTHAQVVLPAWERARGDGDVDGAELVAGELRPTDHGVVHVEREVAVREGARAQPEILRAHALDRQHDLPRDAGHERGGGAAQKLILSELCAEATIGVLRARSRAEVGEECVPRANFGARGVGHEVVDLGHGGVRQRGGVDGRVGVRRGWGRRIVRARRLCVGRRGFRIGATSADQREDQTPSTEHGGDASSPSLNRTRSIPGSDHDEASRAADARAQT